MHELGLVTHVIDTSDCSPIKQPPRRIPFALREKVDQLVNRLWVEFAVYARAHRTRLIERQTVILKSCDKTDHNSCVEGRYRKVVTRTMSGS
jgi:hypothetical protein